MPLMWWEYALMGALFISILLAFIAGGFGFLRLRVQKWIGGAIGQWLMGQAEQAAKEGQPGSGAPGSSSPGVIDLGGFKIDVVAIREIVAVLPEIVSAIKTIQSLGFLGGGGSGGQTPNPFLKP